MSLVSPKEYIHEIIMAELGIEHHIVRPIGQIKEASSMKISTSTRVCTQFICRQHPNLGAVDSAALKNPLIMVISKAFLDTMPHILLLFIFHTSTL